MHGLKKIVKKCEENENCLIIFMFNYAECVNWS